ncbi:MAG: 50S ribosomal protein L21 [Chloroflexi bacterium]|nr:50S ribosomal protein L21 [Chloroflexota bacterium]
MYALIETGGKQYKVSPGQIIQVDKLSVAEGSEVELDKVLLVADNDKITTGRPYVEGARVLATAAGDGLGKKVIVFKFKAKTRYRKKRGHRQPFTKLAIKDIVVAGAGS